MQLVHLAYFNLDRAFLRLFGASHPNLIDRRESSHALCFSEAARARFRYDNADGVFCNKQCVFESHRMLCLFYSGFPIDILFTAIIRRNNPFSII